ncbi:MAG: hypothetical protein UW81_C0030G0003 [Candidatus Giovannonibacteria bacterium GW2011_GWC2_44_9]|uniref:Histidine kinase N-terminal 7TM region domain-containing protein n=3 Tax=Candidatus Giovannoniibacteriota TaxID=1752738 RepID=A0A0G1L6G9_9BACT|nr:MAG: hypothetical protein UW49_C0002G0102 [Candidatus Giovannonibacteria bacterium GW2011_GWB1_44_23]KKT64222.1 MAG: hypothetical protein UW57_C0002G0102 [Candidatus Giovannonibacteria bacterium GW2011_GWA1_44_29]KKT82950.1 MAG: hypothetical protein UW81_C0030G0003 [Candidatus Giovannonibacteria bacterium GW2011_GWC2_44_9]KKT91823.1 MAG: hypothetical protein UW93_C0003G0103 [Parcubacteria group bacterium GW2011_GWC1_45_13]
MFLFSVSSFIDLLNSFICFLIYRRLWNAYRRAANDLVRNFYFFYLFFAIFFFFLGLPFFVPSMPGLIQLSFVVAHLFLYLAIAVFIYLFFKLVGWKSNAFSSAVLVAITGFLVFIFSFFEGGVARLWMLSPQAPNIISWSHGGSDWVRLLIGLGGAVLALGWTIFFIFFSTNYVQNPALAAKGKFLGLGVFMLGLAAVLAFVLSVFNFYNFWIVFLAELVTIFGLLVIYRAIALHK